MTPNPSLLAEAEEELFAPPSFPPGHFATAELEDDSNPDGAVVLRDKAGNVAAVVSRAAFDAWLTEVSVSKSELRAKGLKTLAKGLSRGFAEPDPMPPARLNRHERRAEAARKRRDRS